MANSNSNRSVVPEAKDALNKFKYEVASDVAVKNISTLLATSFLFIIFQIKMLFYFYSYLPVPLLTWFLLFRQFGLVH